MGQATTARRCGSRRRSLLAGFMRSGTPYDVFSFLLFYGGLEFGYFYVGLY